MGCMALLKSALPIRTAPANGIRGVLQLCYSLVRPFFKPLVNSLPPSPHPQASVSPRLD